MIKNPPVSVIVTTKNEEGSIERLLKSIKKQTYKNIEIIVVDNNSNDKTKEISRKYTNKVFNFGPERSSQRNYGVRKSKGKYLLILDADMELSKSVIEECVETIKKDNENGEIVIPERSIAETYWEKVKAFERSFYNLQGDSATDAARFFSRVAFNKAGGYDETITGPEDWDLPEVISKLGYKTKRIKSVICHYENIKSPLQVARKKYYYALKSHRYFKKQNISVVSPKTMYFLRPVFYKNWKRIAIHPLLSTGMSLMLFLEFVFGGVGYLIGRYTNK